MWITVDKAGLAQILEERGKVFALMELLQNSWDTNATKVTVTLEKIPGESWAELIVEDNDPEGFYDLAHAYTMFAPSIKKDDPTKRGRFNLGEKLVLSMCKRAEVRSTKGSVQFNEDGTRTRTREGKTKEGSVFEAIIKMTKAEYQECVERMFSLLPPKGVDTYFNGDLLLWRTPKLIFEVTLPTVTMDSDGNLTKKTKRKCEVEVYEPAESEDAMLYEMGIPVVESDSRFHINVQQKVPLNVDRDNVTPAYLKKVRVEVLNRVHKELSEEEAGDTWVTDALGHTDVESEAVETTMTKRFGEDRAVYDPNDIEAGHRIAARGGTVVHGGSLPKDVWQNVRRSEAIIPAGKVNPTPKPYSSDPDAEPAEFLPSEEWTPGIVEVVALATELGKELLGVNIEVSICRNASNFAACYGNGRLDFSLKRLGWKWFDNWKEHRKRITSLLVHEFAHHGNVGHLEDRYHEAEARMAGDLVELALERPELFTDPVGSTRGKRKARKKAPPRPQEMRAERG